MVLDAVLGEVLLYNYIIISHCKVKLYNLGMKKKSISQKTARRFLVAYHGLDRYSDSGREKSILNYFRKVGSVQFDPLDICGRNAELVLQSRVRNFRPSDLYKLLYSRRELTEGWDKMMCIYNMQDYPYFRRRRDRDMEYFNSDHCSEIREISRKIKEAIREKGPLSSLDLDIEGKIDWAWAPAKLSKAALEILFYSGQLAIDNRIHSRRVYDLAEKIIPPELFNSSDPHPEEEGHTDWRILRRIKGLGLYYDRSGDGWLGMMKKKERDPSLKRLVEREKLIPVAVEGLDYNFFIPAEGLELLKAVEQGNRKISRNIRFLAPLDNFMWDRFLIEKLYGFQYRWEVYKPVVEREYGYYVLPVLYGDKIIARFEPVRNKKEKILKLKGWWWEPQVRIDDKLMASVERSLLTFASFLECRIHMDEALSIIRSA